MILGVSALAAGALIVKRDLIDLDLPLLAASQVLLIFILRDGFVSFFEALISIAAVSIYIYYTIKQKRPTGHKHKKENTVKLVGVILGSALLIFLGAKYTVDPMLQLGTALGIGASALAATALAIGTSLPELVVSVTAAKKRRFEMAIGNIFGSNIFNSAGIIGIIGLFTTLPASSSILAIGMPFLIVAVTLCVISGISKKIHSWEGAFFLVIYALFIAQMFGLL